MNNAAAAVYRATIKPRHIDMWHRPKRGIRHWWLKVDSRRGRRAVLIISHVGTREICHALDKRLLVEWRVRM